MKKSIEELEKENEELRQHINRLMTYGLPLGEKSVSEIIDDIVNDIETMIYNEVWKSLNENSIFESVRMTEIPLIEKLEE